MAKKKHNAGKPRRPLVSHAVQATALPVSAALTTSNSQLSGTVLLVLGAVFGVALLLGSAALVPSEVLPTTIFELVVPRRDVLVSAAGALVLGVVVGLVAVALS